MRTANGLSGESVAAYCLSRKGFHIIARNIRLARGELDIIACSDELLLFVEVKAHKTRESGLLAVNIDKCERLYSAAQACAG